MKYGFHALQDRVVVVCFDAPKTSPGGIVIPDSAKESSREGYVVAVGPGRLLDSGERVTAGVEPGDKVVFAKYAGAEVVVGGEKFVVLRPQDLLLRLEEATPE